MMKKCAYIGIGSNIGYRTGYINDAIHHLSYQSHTNVINTSCLYETKPMYYENQDLFLNAVAHIQTKLSPTELLSCLQDIENKLGRNAALRAVRNGPRPIDLDVLLYHNADTQSINHSYNSKSLCIPHPRMNERPFVLTPLNDIISSSYASSTDASLSRILSLYINNKEIIWRQSEKKSRLMGILNCTPDSFSDGDKDYASLEHIMKKVVEMVAYGADIIDVGGESTRPCAVPVDVDEELQRVIPVIEAIRSHHDVNVANIPLSIDSYKSKVVYEAVKHGANMINDISGGLYDENMFDTVAKLNVPYVMMHVRGRPTDMMNNEHTIYKNIVQDVQQELKNRVDLAVKHGIKRWNIILDPGLGFAKHPKQSYELVKRIHECIPYDLPLLVGPSRKGFIGYALKQHHIDNTDVDSNERMYGTAGIVAALTMKHVDIIRIHDVKAMKCVTSVLNYIQ